MDDLSLQMNIRADSDSLALTGAWGKMKGLALSSGQMDALRKMIEEGYGKSDKDAKEIQEENDEIQKFVDEMHTEKKLNQAMLKSLD